MADDLQHDLLIVGGGGAGLRAVIAAAEAYPDLDIAMLSKVYPMRSHTVSAEGGAAAVIKDNDSLEEHIHDTISGADWLADQDVIIAPPSTTFYDCAIMKKNAICTRKIIKNREKSLSNNSDDFDPILDFFPNPTSIQQVKKIIEDKSKINFEDEKLLNLLKKQTNYPNSQESLEILCEDLSSFLKNKKTNKIRKIFGLIIFELYRYLKNFKYLIFRILGIENKEESASFVMTSSKIKYINKLIEK